MLTCKLCNEQFTTLNSHLRHKHKMNGKEYRALFPGAELTSKSVRSKIRKNSTTPYMAEHWIKQGMSNVEAMRTAAEYKQRQAARMSSGESSVRRVEFWMLKGLTEDEALAEVSKQQSRGLDWYIKHNGVDEGTEKWAAHIVARTSCNKKEAMLSRGYSEEDIRKIRDNTSLESYISRHGEEEGTKRYEANCASKRIDSKRCVEYWIEHHGMNITDATNVVSEHQRNSLEKMIDKYGEVEGRQRYKNWTQAAAQARSAAGSGPSKESLEFFKPIVELLELNKIQYEYEYKIQRTDIPERSYYYDLYVPQLNIIVEYDGVAFHADPSYYNPDWTSPYGVTYKESIKLDNNKSSLVELNKITLVRYRSDDPTRQDNIKELFNNLIKEHLEQ